MMPTTAVATRMLTKFSKVRKFVPMRMHDQRAERQEPLEEIGPDHGTRSTGRHGKPWSRTHI